MSVYPHSQFFLGPSFTAVISGPHIQVVCTSTGDVLHTTVGQDDLLKPGPIRCSAVDPSNEYLATSEEDKQLKIWKIDGLKLLSERELPKRPTNVAFTADSQTILVSDKFGDIFSYPFHFTPLTVKQKKDALSSHENPSGGQLILGHASLLNAFLLSPDEKYIITADRDEHIRISWYPQGYNIEMYCLGHAKFISAIHNPPFAPSELISGGGDPAFKIWDWMAGTVKHEIKVWDAVEPYIKVRSAKHKRGDDGEEPHEGTRRGKGKKAKAQGKAKAKEDTTATMGVQTAEASTSAELVAEKCFLPESTAAEVPQVDLGEKVLVIHKIETVTSESRHHIIFSAVGATALFTCLYPDDTAITDVRSFDLGQPVVDFVAFNDGLIWVSLDGNWFEDESKPIETPVNLVRVLKLSAGELYEISHDSVVLSALNKKCLVPATVNDLEKLDIYGDLTAMPKNTDAEQDQASGVLIADENAPGGKQVSKKELGRLKSKQAVLAKVQAGGGNVGDEEMQEPEPKKSKSERGDDVPESGQDVQMTDVTV